MIYDVSVLINAAIPVWPTDPPVKLTTETLRSEGNGHLIRITHIEMGSHTGTHIDAPWHFIDNGRRLTDIPLDTLVGAVTVFEIAGVRSISKKEVDQLPLAGIERILFKTENSSHWQDGVFYESFVYLEPEAAVTLADRGIKLVGIDYLSIDAFASEKHPTHLVLFDRNVVIVEGLNLSGVPAGNYRMTALPLNLQSGDGAPTRVILQPSL